MRKSIIVVTAVLMLTASVAVAQLSQTYQDWADGPVKFLFTEGETRTFQNVTSDVLAQEFIDLFWARRDPDLTTAENEFQLNFEFRVEYADENFGSERVRGALSDRARVLFLFGFPTEVTTGRGEFGPARARREANVQMWAYEGDDLPEGFRGDRMEFVFAEFVDDSNHFELQSPHRRVARAMDDRPEQLLLHPRLTEIAELGLVAGSDAATDEELAVFDLDPWPWPDGANATAVQGLRSEVSHPIWLFVELPAAVPEASHMIGRARPVNPGPEARSFVVDVDSLSVPGGRGYELNVPTGEGEWRLDIALMGEAGPLAVTTVDAVAEEVPRRGTHITPWYWGAEARQDPGSVPGDPFNIGGWHVIPRLSNTYSNQENLTYFAYILRPDVPEGEQPRFALTTAVYLGERRLIEQTDAANLSRVGENVWMFGHSLPLSFLQEPEEYTIELTLTDRRSELSRTGRIPVIIPEK